MSVESEDQITYPTCLQYKWESAKLEKFTADYEKTEQTNHGAIQDEFSNIETVPM